jgi:DNA-binding IclR family transcriptional regulator
LRFGKLVPDVAEIRKRGWISEPSFKVEGVWNITVPVRIPGGYAALTVPRIRLPKDHNDDKPLLAACQKTAEAITAALHFD